MPDYNYNHLQSRHAVPKHGCRPVEVSHGCRHSDPAVAERDPSAIASDSWGRDSTQKSGVPYDSRRKLLLEAIGLVMAALRSRCGHYIFALWFLHYLSSFLFPRLISAVADWMYTILPHMVSP